MATLPEKGSLQLDTGSTDSVLQTMAQKCVPPKPLPSTSLAAVHGALLQQTWMCVWWQSRNMQMSSAATTSFRCCRIRCISGATSTQCRLTLRMVTFGFARKPWRHRPRRNSWSPRSDRSSTNPRRLVRLLLKRSGPHTRQARQTRRRREVRSRSAQRCHRIDLVFRHPGSLRSSLMASPPTP